MILEPPLSFWGQLEDWELKRDEELFARRRRLDKNEWSIQFCSEKIYLKLRKLITKIGISVRNSPNTWKCSIWEFWDIPKILCFGFFTFLDSRTIVSIVKEYDYTYFMWNVPEYPHRSSAKFTHNGIYSTIYAISSPDSNLSLQI